MLRVHPTPFCVFDEVDAALDEANAGRVCSLLQQLAQQTQLIIVTHNRVTIEAATILYGVTMGSDGASRVLSLRLPTDQATNAAD
jgi:chromosome segregation protein